MTVKFLEDKTVRWPVEDIRPDLKGQLAKIITVTPKATTMTIKFLENEIIRWPDEDGIRPDLKGQLAKIIKVTPKAIGYNYTVKVLTGSQTGEILAQCTGKHFRRGMNRNNANS